MLALLRWLFPVAGRRGCGPKIVLCFLCLVSASAAGHAAEPPLRWAADAEGGAPYIFKDPKDPSRYLGFEVELAAALEKELGRRIEFVQYDFKSLDSGLDRGDFDFAMNGLEKTPDREKVLRFSRPYYVYALQLVARRDETRFRSLEECRQAGGLVGTLENTAADRLLDQEHVRKKIYGNQTEPYLDLELGRIDAVLLDLPIAIYCAGPNEKLKFVGERLAPGYYGIAFRKDREELAAKFDEALQRLLDRGELRRIYEKWGLWNEDQEKLRTGGLEQVLRDRTGQFQFLGYLPDLLAGALVTIELSVLGMMLAVSLGLPIAMARLYGPRPLQLAATVYVEFFRGIPVLLLLYFLYFGLPKAAAACHLPFELNLGPITAAVLGFGLNYAAYEAEIYRAGISSIPVGQWEAGASLGMSRLHTFRRIILPQAVRVILPPMTNDFVALFKDTSVVSIVAVVELSKQYQILAKTGFQYIEIGLVTALLYLIMSVPLGYLSRYLERRWGKGR